jgi:Flp pilus assembly protein CpaB
MTYRIRNILIAVGLALVAMLLTLFYVTNYKRTVQHSAKDVSVYVASNDIAPGTSGADVVRQHDLKVESVAQRNVVPGAITSPQQIARLVVSEPVYSGEQVTLRHFSDVAAQGIRSQLKGALRAIQLTGDPNQLLAGTLEAGDHVDLVANLRLPGNSAAADKVVLRNLLVLTAPNVSVTGKVSSPSGAVSAIVQVTEAQAPRLFFVLKNGDWTLELRPVVGSVDTSGQVETLNTILGGLR